MYLPSEILAPVLLVVFIVFLIELGVTKLNDAKRDDQPKDPAKTKENENAPP